jgi:hypothetical protein
MTTPTENPWKGDNVAAEEGSPDLWGIEDTRDQVQVLRDMDSSERADALGSYPEDRPADLVALTATLADFLGEVEEWATGVENERDELRIRTRIYELAMEQLADAHGWTGRFALMLLPRYWHAVVDEDDREIKACLREGAKLAGSDGYNRGTGVWFSKIVFEIKDTLDEEAEDGKA